MCPTGVGGLGLRPGPPHGCGHRSPSSQGSDTVHPRHGGGYMVSQPYTDMVASASYVD